MGPSAGPGSTRPVPGATLRAAEAGPGPSSSSMVVVPTEAAATRPARRLRSSAVAPGAPLTAAPLLLHEQPAAAASAAAAVAAAFAAAGTQRGSAAQSSRAARAAARGSGAASNRPFSAQPPLQASPSPQLSHFLATRARLPPLEQLLPALGGRLHTLVLVSCALLAVPPTVPRTLQRLLGAELEAVSALGPALVRLHVQQPGALLLACGSARSVGLLCGTLGRLPSLRHLCFEVPRAQQDRMLEGLSACRHLATLVVCSNVRWGHTGGRAGAGVHGLSTAYPPLRGPALASL